MVGASGPRRSPPLDLDGHRLTTLTVVASPPTVVAMTCWISPGPVGHPFDQLVTLYWSLLAQTFVNLALVNMFANTAFFVATCVASPSVHHLL